MKVYQLSKIGGWYRWTGSFETPGVPPESDGYFWTSDINLAKSLSNTIFDRGEARKLAAMGGSSILDTLEQTIDN